MMESCASACLIAPPADFFVFTHSFFIFTREREREGGEGASARECALSTLVSVIKTLILLWGAASLWLHLIPIAFEKPSLNYYVLGF